MRHENYRIKLILDKNQSIIWRRTEREFNDACKMISYAIEKFIRKFNVIPCEDIIINTIKQSTEIKNEILSGAYHVMAKRMVKTETLRCSRKVRCKSRLLVPIKNSSVEVDIENKRIELPIIGSVKYKNNSHINNEIEFWVRMVYTGSFSLYSFNNEHQLLVSRLNCITFSE